MSHLNQSTRSTARGKGEPTSFQSALATAVNQENTHQAHGVELSSSRRTCHPDLCRSGWCGVSRFWAIIPLPGPLAGYSFRFLADLRCLFKPVLAGERASKVQRTLSFLSEPALARGPALLPWQHGAALCCRPGSARFDRRRINRRGVGRRTDWAEQQDPRYIRNYRGQFLDGSSYDHGIGWIQLLLFAYSWRCRSRILGPTPAACECAPSWADLWDRDRCRREFFQLCHRPRSVANPLVSRLLYAVSPAPSCCSGPRRHCDCRRVRFTPVARSVWWPDARS